MNRFMFVLRKGKEVKCLTTQEGARVDALMADGWTHESTLDAWTVLNILYTATDEEAQERFNEIRKGLKV